jgi:hypothetical protein
MPKPKSGKRQQQNKDSKDEVAQAARERELRDLIGRVEAEKSGAARPTSESPHDFVERRMRDKSKS